MNVIQTLKEWGSIILYRQYAIVGILFRIKHFFTGKRVRLEASSMCQLQCPSCPTGLKENMKGTVGWGYLKFDNFKKLVDENPDIKYIELSNWGEILLNPHLIDILRYAHEKNIEIQAHNGINLNTANDKVLEAFVKYQVKFLSVSIDGATNETYQIYRRNGDINNVFHHIEKINEYKQKYNSKYPKLRWQFIIFGHNEKDLPLAKKLANKYNMEFFPKLNWDLLYSPIKDPEFVKRETGLSATSRDEYKKKKLREYILPCYQLWISPQINWDGKLLGCCVNVYGDFGNVFEVGLKQAMKSRQYVNAQRALREKEKLNPDNPCAKCPVYYNQQKKSEMSKTFYVEH